MLLNLEPQLLIILIFCLMLSLSFHEFAHAFSANFLGDPTAKIAGRLTINPFVHLDLFGSIMVLLAGFGYAKPVPVNSRNFKSIKADSMVAAAGPIMNLFLSLFGALIFNLFVNLNIFQFFEFPLARLLTIFMIINLNLFIFNLIPLGPLDGSYVLKGILSRNLSIRYDDWNQKYGYYVLLALVLISITIPNIKVFYWIHSLSRSIMIFLIN